MHLQYSLRASATCWYSLCLPTSSLSIPTMALISNLEHHSWNSTLVLEGLEHVVILLGQLVNLHARVLGLGVNNLSEECSTVTRLTVGHPLGVIQTSGEGDLVLLEGSQCVLCPLNLVAKVLVLHIQLLLGEVSLIEGLDHLVQLLIRCNHQTLGHLAILLHVGMLAKD